MASGFVWHPPLRMGDLARAAASRGPAAIGVVDGVFGGAHGLAQEILWAMAQGIPVYGAASIEQALRAAELAPVMRGVGTFAAYGDGTLIDNDEVALLHGRRKRVSRP